MKRFAVVLSMALMAAPFLFTTPLEAGAPIRVGALYPITGSLALLGEESWRGAEIARQFRNQKGGVAGRQVEFLRADVPDVNAAKSEAERLISRESMKLLIGTYSSSLSLAASEVSARQNVTFFELGGISDQITERGYKTIFRTCPKAQLFSKSQLAFVRDWIAPQIKKKPAEVRVSLVHEDSAYGSSIARKGGSVASFLLDPEVENNIEGPITLAWGGDEPHIGMRVYWVVKENTSGQFVVSA